MASPGPPALGAFARWTVLLFVTLGLCSMVWFSWVSSMSKDTQRESYATSFESTKKALALIEKKASILQGDYAKLNSRVKTTERDIKDIKEVMTSLVLRDGSSAERSNASTSFVKSLPRQSVLPVKKIALATSMPSATNSGVDETDENGTIDASPTRKAKVSPRPKKIARASDCVANRGKDGRAGPLVTVRGHRLEKVPQGLFDPLVAQKYGLVLFGPAGPAAMIDIWGMLNTMKQPSNQLDHGKVIFLLKSDLALYTTRLLHHPNLLAIFKEFTVRNISTLRLSDSEAKHMWRKWPTAVICNSPKFVSSQPCIDEDKRQIAKHPDDPLFNASQMKSEIRTRRMRTVNWNFHQYYEMEPHAKALRGMPVKTRRLLNNSRKYDVFFAVHFRDPEATPLELHRMAVLVALHSWTGPKIVHGCSKHNKVLHQRYSVTENELSERCLSPREYAHGIMMAKIAVCTWGFGERTGCDVNALLFGAILVKPWMDWVVAYPDIYRNGTYYFSFEPDASDLTDKIGGILQTYDNHYGMRHNAQQFVMQWVDYDHFKERFWAQVCEVYKENLRK